MCFIFMTLQVLAYSNAQEEIRSYIKNNFPADFTVSEPQIAQLAWALEHEHPTHDMDARINAKCAYIEVSRALTRLYCARLLRAGTREAYNAFMIAQLDAGVNAPLSFASFNKFSNHIQKLDQLDYELLETAAILSAVSLSKPAAELAQQVMQVRPVINNNMEFLATTLRNEPNIYPLAMHITQNNTAAKKLLYILFPPQTNFRHMLYTEGGIGMFKYLRTMIKHGFIDQEGLDLWYAHWIINIAGFRGHVDQRGSLYLMEPTAQAMHKLKCLVYEMLDTPNFDPLLPYLEYRAQGLGLAHLPEHEKLFFAHLGCLLRLYNFTDGQKLYTSVMRLPLDERQILEDHFFVGLHDATLMTHTYIPAFFGNAMEFTNGDLEQVITHLLPAYNKILRQYQQQNLTLSLSFNQLSSSDNIKYLLQNAAREQRFNILADGTVTRQ